MSETEQHSLASMLNTREDNQHDEKEDMYTGNEYEVTKEQKEQEDNENQYAQSNRAFEIGDSEEEVDY